VLFLSTSFLFLCAQKDKLRIVLPRTAFHLDERFDGGKFVQTNYLIALADVEALFNNVSSYEDVDVVVFEVVDYFSKFILTHVSLWEFWHWFYNVLIFFFVSDAGWVKYLTDKTCPLNAHCNFNPIIVSIELSFTNDTLI